MSRRDLPGVSMWCFFDSDREREKEREREGERERQKQRGLCVILNRLSNVRKQCSANAEHFLSKE